MLDDVSYLNLGSSAVLHKDMRTVWVCDRFGIQNQALTYISLALRSHQPEPLCSQRRKPNFATSCYKRHFHRSGSESDGRIISRTPVVGRHRTLHRQASGCSSTGNCKPRTPQYRFASQLNNSFGPRSLSNRATSSESNRLLSGRYKGSKRWQRTNQHSCFSSTFISCPTIKTSPYLPRPIGQLLESLRPPTIPVPRAPGESHRAFSSQPYACPHSYLGFCMRSVNFITQRTSNP
jgi:hypothetical protein